MFNLNLEQIILWLPAVLVALTFHEYAHGKAADLLGDPTPRYQGRLTLNPIAHLDPIGFLLLLIFHFGWAKPVQVNPLNFKGDRLRGMMLVSLAGPLMNLFIALTGALVINLAFPAGGVMVNSYGVEILNGIIWINIFLALFNLIPVPPLDGSKVLAWFLQSDRFIYQLERYGMMILIVLIFTNFVGVVVLPLASLLYKYFMIITGWIALPFVSIF